MKKITTLFLVGIFVILSITLIAYARGYRIDFKKKEITGTGLLVTTSEPNGASVFLNGHLTTATNNTLNLPPGDYDVRIVKNGYLGWQKKLKVEAEVVSKTEALLFPSTPSLKPLTINGALNPLLSPDSTKIVYAVSSQGLPNDATDRSGLWIFPLPVRPLSFARDPQKIASNFRGFDISEAQIIWSPDSKEIIALFFSDPKKPSSGNVTSAYLISAEGQNTNLRDITATFSLTLKTWEEEKKAKYQDQLLSLPKDFVKVATASASLLAFSPDETKVLYTATTSGTLPQIIKPALIGANSQLEERELKKNQVYVYDVKEDKNFAINSNDHLFWLPTSRHLVSIQKDTISIMEYDGTNNAVFYAGPFINSFVFPWPDASNLVILTNLNKSAGEIPNLYAVSLK
ncbi:PEGA domain-containing protein [Candidatus Gottesmanbacteria bacterium]|nr:PEGA domain-containing protein [Candidatus Gottesmanbacteria bacterium]